MSNSKNPILKSWAVNAKKWIKTIENKEIESRQLVTNTAILQNILQQQPKTVLDIGCGEGRHVFGAMQNYKNFYCIGLDMDEPSLAKAQEGFEFFKSISNEAKSIIKFEIFSLQDKETSDLEPKCLFKVDEYGFFVYWKSDQRVSDYLLNHNLGKYCSCYLV